MDGIALAVTAALAMLLHVGWLVRFAPRRPLGDEGEYLARGQREDPYAPTPFLRVPLMPALFHGATRLVSRPEPVLRALQTGLGVYAVFMVHLAGEARGGWVAGALAATLMLLLVERIVLSAHLWPDTLLCALHATALWLTTLPPTPIVVAALGVVAMLATLTRIEQIALSAGLGLHLLLRPDGPSLVSAAAVILPSLIALGACSLRNRRRYGTALPDDTWSFNVRVLDRQLALQRDGPVRVESTIRSLNSQPGDRDAGRAWRRILARPVALLGSLVVRLLACFGPDSFVSGRLLPPHGVAYPALSIDASDRLRIALRWSGPLVFGFIGFALYTAADVPHHLLVAAPVLLAVVAVHFRTRYRLVLMPWLCVAGAEAAAALDPRRFGFDDAVAALVIATVVITSVLRPVLLEHPAPARARTDPPA